MFVALVTVTFSKVTSLDLALLGLAVAGGLPNGVWAEPRGDIPFDSIPAIANRNGIFFMGDIRTQYLSASSDCNPDCGALTCDLDPLPVTGDL
jgi:hypothetical protein